MFFHECYSDPGSTLKERRMKYEKKLEVKSHFAHWTTENISILTCKQQLIQKIYLLKTKKNCEQIRISKFWLYIVSILFLWKYRVKHVRLTFRRNRTTNIELFGLEIFFESYNVIKRHNALLPCQNQHAKIKFVPL